MTSTWQAHDKHMTSTCSSGFKTFLWSLFEAHPRVVSQLQQDIYIYTFPHSHSHSVHDDNTNYNDDDNTDWLIIMITMITIIIIKIKIISSSTTHHHTVAQCFAEPWRIPGVRYCSNWPTSWSGRLNGWGNWKRSAWLISRSPGTMAGHGRDGRCFVGVSFWGENRGWRWIWRLDGCLTRFDAFFKNVRYLLMVVWNMAFIFP